MPIGIHYTYLSIVPKNGVLEDVSRSNSDYKVAITDVVLLVSSADVCVLGEKVRRLAAYHARHPLDALIEPRIVLLSLWIFHFKKERWGEDKNKL